MADFYLAEGDLASPIFETLTDEDGNAVDIQGKTINLTVTPIHGGTPLINHAANNLQVGDGSDGTKGDVSFGEGANPYTAGFSTGKAGDYLYRWTATGGGLPQSFPNDGYRLLTISPVAPTSAAVYLSVDELKKTLSLSGESYANADIEVAIEAASRGLETAYGTTWTLRPSASEVRYFDGGMRDIYLGDLLHANTIQLDYGLYWQGPGYYFDDYGPGSYGTALSSTDYQLLPLENGLVADGGNGEPYKKLQLVRGSTLYTLPAGARAVKITGQYGWETVPAGVKAATGIVAARILQRAREAPFGIKSLGIDGSVLVAVDIAKDSEIRFMVNGLRPARSLVI